MVFGFGTTGFWATVVCLLATGGSFIAVTGFTSGQVPLGFIGVLLVFLGFYAFVTRLSDLLEERGVHWRWWRD